VTECNCLGIISSWGRNAYTNTMLGKLNSVLLLAVS